ncbi:TonB-dependent receptor [Aquimarina sp. U1-2]|uniref:TonB-dependent receptor plug domain-containing protein n=1 Tax=Aquimarina sp. U1-2 TaxID=2823141 RepID=UPI001AED0B07|nr:TonB-dependent receptor [Aquimarina sp. U1-2]MBP2830650.1 TonB-dependent receptor [Aquimarina sp. U1-2]
MKTYFFAVAALCFVVAKSQDSLKVVQMGDVVITGNKIETPVEKSGKTIFKLKQEEIEANRGKDVTDLLNEIPGIQIDGNFATPGTNISYRIRGAQSEQTLILIDGIPFNDPSGLTQTFDLRMLDLDQVASIEVLKGGLSSLYGTGAAAGVINITLKEAAKEPFKLITNIEVGSFNTFTSNINISGAIDKFKYTISNSYRTSDGFSAALDTIGNQNFDDDGFKSSNVMARLEYQFNDRFSIGLLAARDHIDSDFDAGAFRDDDSELEQELLKFALSPKYEWTSGGIRGNFSYHTNERIFNSPSFSNPDERDISEFNGNTLQADIIVDQAITKDIKLVGGVNFQRPEWEPEDADDESFTMIDPYVSIIHDYENFNFQLGGRLNNHSLYGTNFVWNINPSYNIKFGNHAVKILGSYATAFLSPSLNQLYAGDFGFLEANAGNPDLEPQDSETAEGGFEWRSTKKFKLSAVYFYRKDENLIDFIFNDDFTIGTYTNVEGETKVDGVELTSSYSFLPQLILTGHYTYTRSLDDEVILRRVPENKFGFTLSAIPVKDVLIKVTHLHVGEVPENEEITLDAYDLFDGVISYTFKKKLSVSGSINNIFDTDYVDRFGWTAAERNYNIGLRYEF